MAASGRWWPSRTDLPIQTLEGVRQDLFYPALTWEYYEAVLGRMQPWDNLWVVCMEELVQVSSTVCPCVRRCAA